MAFPGRAWKDRAQDLHKRSHPVVLRLVVALIGSVLLTAGAVLLILPGPGLLLIAAGVAVLALEFSWARQLESRAQAALKSLLDRLKIARKSRP